MDSNFTDVINGISRHAFINDDCMKVLPTMPSKCVDTTIVDIPYEQRRLQIIENGKRKTDGEIDNSSVNRVNFDLREFLEQITRVTKNSIIIFCGQLQVSPIWEYFESLGNGSIRQLIWEKTNPNMMSSFYAYSYNVENIILYRFNGTRAFNGGLMKSSVFHFASGGSNKIHPTEKNHDLLRELILDNSNENEIIFDACAGSFSTCLVALQCNRRTIGIEIDEKYYRSAIARLEQRGDYQYSLFDEDTIREFEGVKKVEEYSDADIRLAMEKERHDESLD